MNRRDILSLASSAGVGFLLLRLTPGCGLAAAEDDVEPIANKKRGTGASGDDGANGESVDTIDPGAIDTRKPTSEGDGEGTPGGESPNADAGSPPGSPADSGTGATPGAKVTLYDTNAQALYFDGGYGPFTGVIKVDYVIANKALTLDFWHGHGGSQHRFTLLPEHFAALKRLERVTLETSVVDGHQHKLFIDPVDPRFRVPGAMPVSVPV